MGNEECSKKCLGTKGLLGQRGTTWAVLRDLRQPCAPALSHHCCAGHWHEGYDPLPFIQWPGGSPRARHTGHVTKGTTVGQKGDVTEGTMVGHKGHVTKSTMVGHKENVTKGTMVGHEGHVTKGWSQRALW